MRPQLSLALLPALLFAAFTWSCAPDPPHDAGERFPLEGQHAALPCEQCHGPDGFEALPTECAACHEDTRPPDHYPGDCGECHNALAWNNFTGGTQPTNVNPHDTTFPLIGSHVLDCGTCHTGPDYTGLDPTCGSCHEAERPPYHYPEDCASCHPTTLWADGVVHRVDLPHHAAACSSCHPDAANRKSFTCTTGCHAQAATDPLHSAIASYVYESGFCADCHFPP